MLSRVPSEETPGNGWKSHQARSLSGRRLAEGWQVHRSPSGLRTGVVRRLVASGLRSWSLQGASRAERVRLAVSGLPGWLMIGTGLEGCR